MGYAHIAGIDPSMTSTGAAIYSARSRDVDLHRITSKALPPEHKDDYTWRDDRITDIVFRVADVIPHGSLVLMETPFIPQKMAAGALVDRLWLWGQMFHTLRHNKGCVMYPLTPQARMTYATGKGNASKDTVLAAMIRRYTWLDITGNDQADAAAFMAIGCRLDGDPIDGELAKIYTRALDKLPPFPALDPVNPFERAK